MRKQSIITVAALALAGVIMSSCSSDMEDRGHIIKEKGEIILPEGAWTTACELSGFYVRFTADMAEYVFRATPGGGRNVVVSPLSAAMVFSMAANGLDGEQRRAYTDYLGVSDLNSLNVLCAALTDRLPESDLTAKFKTASSVWVNKSFNLTLTGEAASILSGKYRADIRYADFAEKNGETLRAINEWCAGNTDRLIPACLENLNPGNLAVILNALYFKAPWSGEIFDAERTEPRIFHGLESDTEVGMMESDYFDGWYSRAEGFEYFTIDFGNGAFTLKILLPEEGRPMEESIRALTPERLAAVRENGTPCPLKVYLPKFAAGGKYNLNDMLEASGVSGLTGDLRFTMFTAPQTGSIHYSHAATFSIDEDGAEAAAETTGEFLNTAAPSGEADPVTVRVDRPFFFFIEEFSTCTCILSGCITDL